ncbi:dienelactone hydrolase family protein [Acidihalobacter prosperus]
MSDLNINSDWIDINAEMRGYLAHPTNEGSYPAVIVFIEAFGVNNHFQQLATRLAHEGYIVLVPDLYHGSVYDYSDINNAIAHLRSLNDEQVMEETGKALDVLAAQPNINKQKPGVLGFCMGGRYAFLTNGAISDRVGATVSYYGGGIAPTKDVAGRPPLLDKVPAMQAPLLMHYGAADTSIAPDEHARIVEKLSHAKKRYGIEVYPGAGHGFFCDQRDSYHPEAAAESWDLTLHFFERYIKE